MISEMVGSDKAAQLSDKMCMYTANSILPEVINAILEYAHYQSKQRSKHCSVCLRIYGISVCYISCDGLQLGLS